WLDGARWFWDTLVDADLANNTLNWQWAAGTGSDAATYPRIFNPVTQGEKFDPKGEYVRAWLPELAQLPHAYVHRPWTAPAAIRAPAAPPTTPAAPRRSNRPRTPASVAPPIRPTPCCPGSGGCSGHSAASSSASSA